MKKLICLLFCCLLFLPAAAQWKWHNPMEAGFPVIQNQGFTKEIGNSYTRLPERAKGVVSEPVWNLSQHSAGLAIHFYSNAPRIKVRYTVTGSLNMPHMPSTGVSCRELTSTALTATGNGIFVSATTLSRTRSPTHIIT